VSIVWSDRSLLDLRSIRDYIARDSDQSAREFLRKLINHVSILESAPKTGRKVPELDTDTIRELVFGNYRIVYTWTPESIYIVTVFEGHRLPDFDSVK
jgi:Plasmid stabilization system protein